MDRFTKILSETFICLLLVTFSLSAFARESSDDQWNFQLATYGWLSGQEGTIKPFSRAPAVDIDLDFWDDISDNINGALYLIGEARKGSFGVVMDVVYSDIEFKGQTLGSIYSSLSSQTQTWMITTAGFYRVIDNPSNFVDLLAGVRYWSVESTIGYGSGTLPGVEVSNRKDWFDPLIGVKGLSFLGQSKFFISGGILLGGFGASSDMMWDATLNLGYNWTKTFSTTIGYRYMDVDYKDNGFQYDVSQDGPTFGLSWRF